MATCRDVCRIDSETAKSITRKNPHCHARFIPARGRPCISRMFRFAPRLHLKQQIGVPVSSLIGMFVLISFLQVGRKSGLNKNAFIKSTVTEAMLLCDMHPGNADRLSRAFCCFPMKRSHHSEHYLQSKPGVKAQTQSLAMIENSSLTIDMVDLLRKVHDGVNVKG